jgi:hypothetical protein
MTSHVRRYLYRASLSLKAIVKGLKALCVGPPYPMPSVAPRFCREVCPAGRFFFIVVEVPAEDKALIRLMQVNPSVAAAIQLPDGCQFRTCFEISAEYAKVIINM